MLTRQKILLKLLHHVRQPRIFLFDEVGREKKLNFKPQKSDAGWKVVIQLRDWQEIAVIEESRK